MCHTQKENRKEQQGRSSLVPVGRKKQVFRSRAGRERRNPLELPGALSSRSADLCCLQRQGPNLLRNPQQTFRQICDCQTSYVIALHPVSAERLLNGGFSAWFWREALYSCLLCQAATWTVAFEGVCTRAAIHPAKNGGASGFRNCGQRGEAAVKRSVTA